MSSTATLDRPFVQGSATSLAASIDAKALAIDARARVFACINAAGIHGRTRQEIEGETGLDGNTVRPRVAELIVRDLIRPSGDIRRSPTGRACEVLVAKEFAQ